MKKHSTQKQKGFIKYIVIFIVLVVVVAVFNIDVKAIIESAFVQEVIYYIKVVLAFIYDSFVFIIEQFQSDGGETVEDIATTTVESTQ